MNDETTTSAEAPVTEAPAAAPVAKATKKAKPAKKDAPAGRPKGVTFNDIMKTRLPDGSLRKAHVDLLRGLAKAGGAISMDKLTKASKVNYRTARPTVSFLVSEGLAKEQLSPDESGTMLYRITGDGTKALSKAEKAA